MGEGVREAQTSLHLIDGGPDPLHGNAGLADGGQDRRLGQSDERDQWLVPSWLTHAGDDGLAAYLRTARGSSHVTSRPHRQGGGGYFDDARRLGDRVERVSKPGAVKIHGRLHSLPGSREAPTRTCRTLAVQARRSPGQCPLRVRHRSSRSACRRRLRTCRAKVRLPMPPARPCDPRSRPCPRHQGVRPAVDGPRLEVRSDL